jgi:transcription-repair coupling factor (superfamily II helicase)
MSLIPTIGLPKGRAGQFIVDGVADGYEAFALVQAALEIAPDKPVLFVARDGQRLPSIVEALAFAAPGLPVLELPAWDCLPYDRVSPGSDAAAKRLDALTAMIALAKKPHRAVILTTANALLQRIPPASLVESQTFHAKPGNQIDMNALVSRLETSGFERVYRAWRWRVRGARRHSGPVRARLDRGVAARLLRRHAGIDPRLRRCHPTHHRPAQIDGAAGDERSGADA